MLFRSLDSQTKKKIMLQYAVFGMNLPVVDNEKYAKGLKSIYAGDPDGFDILKAFKKGSNEGTRYMDMHRIRNLVNDEIDRAIALLQNYKEVEQLYTSYYPGEAYSLKLPDVAWQILMPSRLEMGFLSS